LGFGLLFDLGFGRLGGGSLLAECLEVGFAGGALGFSAFGSFGHLCGSLVLEMVLEIKWPA
jgi:hypothetical protein